MGDGRGLPPGPPVAPAAPRRRRRPERERERVGPPAGAGRRGRAPDRGGDRLRPRPPVRDGRAHRVDLPRRSELDARSARPVPAGRHAGGHRRLRHRGRRPRPPARCALHPGQDRQELRGCPAPLRGGRGARAGCDRAGPRPGGPHRGRRGGGGGRPGAAGRPGLRPDPGIPPGAPHGTDPARGVAHRLARAGGGPCLRCSPKANPRRPKGALRRTGTRSPRRSGRGRPAASAWTWGSAGRCRAATPRPAPSPSSPARRC